MRTSMRILKIIGISFALIFILLVLAIWIPTSVHYKGKAQEGEVKSNLHTIKIGLEKYREEHGQYPAQLLGGDKEGWDYYNANRPDGTPYLVDPLIEFGYFDSYPENPFTGGSLPRNDKKALREFRKRVRAEGDGPFDPRFGLNGDKMGNVLMEPFLFVKQRDKSLKGYPRLCPGQFYYRAYGGIKSIEELDGIGIDNPDEYKPDFYGYFILGAFGSIDTTGHDAIRWKDLDGNLPMEFPYISPDNYYQSPTGDATEIQLRLPEVVGSEYDYTPPVWPPLDDNSGYLIIGAPDGSRDGVIIVLRGNWWDREIN